MWVPSYGSLNSSLLRSCPLEGLLFIRWLDYRPVSSAFSNCEGEQNLVLLFNFTMVDLIFRLWQNRKHNKITASSSYQDKLPRSGLKGGKVISKEINKTY